MYLCDKCRYYDRCFPRTLRYEEEIFKKADVELGGCPSFDELPIDEMFAKE